MIDFSDDIFVDEEGKTYTEEEKHNIILQKILNDTEKVTKRSKNIGIIYKQIIKELYDIDPVSGVQFMKTFENIPDLKNISFLNNSEDFKEKVEEISFLTSVVFALNTLPKDETEILWKHYFYNCKKKENKPFFSRSTVYRLRMKGSKYMIKMTNNNYLKLIEKRKDLK